VGLRPAIRFATRLQLVAALTPAVASAMTMLGYDRMLLFAFSFSF